MEFAMPPPVLADRSGDVGEEGQVERAGALVDQVTRIATSGAMHHDRREDGEAGDQVVRSPCGERCCRRMDLRLEVHAARAALLGCVLMISAPSPERRA